MAYVFSLATNFRYLVQFLEQKATTSAAERCPAYRTVLEQLALERSRLCGTTCIMHKFVLFLHGARFALFVC